MKVPSGRMTEYSDFGQKLLPRTPVIVEISPISGDLSVFKGGKFLPEVLCGVAECLPHVVFGYTDYSTCSLLLVDYPRWDWFEFQDSQALSSMAASYATMHACDKEIAFTAKSFNLPKDEVINYFIWKQATLAGNLLRMDSLKTTPDAINEFVESGPISTDRLWPGTWWRGRACERVQAPDCNLSTRESVFFWDIDENTPVFNKNRDYINTWVYPPK